MAADVRLHRELSRPLLLHFSLPVHPAFLQAPQLARSVRSPLSIAISQYSRASQRLWRRVPNRILYSDEYLSLRLFCFDSRLRALYERPPKRNAGERCDIESAERSPVTSFRIG